MPLRPEVLRRLGRYGAVSVVTSLVVFGVLGFLVGVVNAPAGWSNVAATLTGIALSFELNRRWAWAGRTNRRTTSQIVSFTSINVAGLVLSTVAVHAVAVVATQHHFARLTRTGAVEAVNIAAWGGLWLIQFVILDRYIFKARADPTLSVAARAPRSIDREHVEIP